MRTFRPPASATVSRCLVPFSFALLLFLIAAINAMAEEPARERDPVAQTPSGQSAPAIPPRNLLVVAIAGVFVAIYWLDRFNVPERNKVATRTEKERFHLPATNRSSTTASRYYSAAVAYCMIGVALYLLLIFSPEAWRHLVEVMKAEGAGTLPPWLNEASSPFVVALALTILVPKLPGLKQGDVWLRRRLRYYAAIPEEVRRLSKQLRASDDPAVETHTFTAPEEARKAVRNGLTAELAEDVKAGVDLNQWIVFEPIVGSADLARRWTKTEVLMRQVRAWEADEGFRRFMVHQSDQIEVLHVRRNALLKRMRELMRVSRAITSSEGTQALAAYREVIAEDARQFLHDLYDFMSAAVLSRNRTKGQISAALGQLGFEVEWRPLRLTVHELALAGILAFLVMISGFLLATVPSKKMTIGHALGISLVVSFASAGAVFSAVMPRDKGWAIARRRASDLPAWGCYLLSGGLAMLLQSPFSLGFRIVREPSLREAWQMFLARDVRGWLWISFAVAAGLAALVDRERPIGSAWLGRRASLLEGLLLGAGLGFSGIVIALVLGERNAPLVPVVTMLAVLGVVLGLVVPSIYRNAPRTRRDTATEGPVFSPAGSQPAGATTGQAARAIVS
jgi:hypothetical protein